MWVIQANEVKYGYIDAGGWVAISPQFQVARPFSEGLAAVCLENRWGFIDKTGKFVISPQFLSAESFSDGLAWVEQPQTGAFGYIDRTGAYVWGPY